MTPANPAKPAKAPAADAKPPVSDKAALIEAFTKAGFAVIPLRGKIPAIAKWGDTEVGQFTPKTLPGNYGVVMGPRDLVVDIDPRNFKPGDKPASRLMKDLGITLDSFSVKTGGGGAHIYFTIPEGFLCVNGVALYPGVEFKSVGRQVVGPGSVHPESGLEYTVRSGSPDIRAEAPAALLALIRAPEKRVKDLEADAGTGKYMCDPGTRERFASFLKQIAEVSVEGRNGDLVAFKTAAQGRDLGLSPDICWELMLEHWNSRCQPPWEAEELKAKVVNAYKYAGGALGGAHPEVDFGPLITPPAPAPKDEFHWDLDKDGKPRKTFVNLLNYLRAPDKGLLHVFGYNEFTMRVEFANPAPWHNGILPRSRTVGDNDLKLLKGYLANRCKFEMPIGVIEEAVTVTAFASKFHPVREYLTGLTWDGVSRIDSWLHDYCGAADDGYTRAAGRKVLVAAVMRVFKPGCKFDHALVLEGEQGIGKSGICRILGGEDWSGDVTIDPHSKDTIQQMQGKWVIELAELEVARRADNDALKAFISRQVDTARLAYGRLAFEFPRQNILIATKNPGADGAYLKDDTGNRRWWPVPLDPKGGMVDFKGLKNVRNQLFAEAVVLAKKGEPLDMDTPELKDAAKEVVKARHAEHPWVDRIGGWLSSQPAARDFITAREVYLEAMEGIEKQLDHAATRAISQAMRSLGWRLAFRRMGGRMIRGYEQIAKRVA